jgi:hypothetical protein
MPSGIATWQVKKKWKIMDMDQLCRADHLQTKFRVSGAHTHSHTAHQAVCMLNSTHSQGESPK